MAHMAHARIIPANVYEGRARVGLLQSNLPPFPELPRSRRIVIIDEITVAKWVKNDEQANEETDKCHPANQGRYFYR